MPKYATGLVAALAMAAASHGGFAGEADAIDGQISRAADGTYRFDVTLRHADEGWDHYADAWEVVAPDGTVLGTRTLLHPHVDEQPFTRSLSGVAIPEGVSEVRIRAHDSAHGYGGSELTLAVPR